MPRPNKQANSKTETMPPSYASVLRHPPSNRLSKAQIAAVRSADVPTRNKKQFTAEPQPQRGSHFATTSAAPPERSQHQSSPVVNPKTPILKTTATGKQYYEMPLTGMEKYETINGGLIMCPADKEVYLKRYYKTVFGTENPSEEMLECEDFEFDEFVEFAPPGVFPQTDIAK
ncbi:hypothetical protein BDD12DRAFT_868415 [Trichophaea hybrida]|nr:hypothetical protein BDD12DRAFT_868415 [Trichophaea hybrida]